VNTPNRPELERVAGSVADAEALDWVALAREHPELSDTLERLRALERLASAHRGVRDAEATPRAGPGTLFVWGPLEVRERLGEGSFGEVFRAHEASLRRDVALKLRRAEAPGAMRQWLDEARRLARVSHPNVLHVLGVAEHDGRAGIWTELVRGETLEARLAREGPLPAREVALIGLDLCRALAAVHAAEVVHGDLKAANVMREGGPGAVHPGRIVLMDFGAGHDGPAASPSTWTPLISAPEVLKGGPAGPAADQYSLGVLLYRLLTNRYPHEADSIAELIAHASATPAPLRERRPDLPALLHDAVTRALAAEPAGRHPNLSALESALAASLDVAPAPGAPASGSPASKHRMLAAWAGLFVAALIAVALWRSRPAPRSLVERPSSGAGAPTVTAPTPLGVRATFVRRTAAGSEPLLDGAAVRTGDRLALDLRSDEPVWAYVVDQDETGAAFALFPLAGLDASNPLGAGIDHRLPGPRRGQPFAWQVTAGGGSERFVVVASRHPLPDLERAVATLVQPAAAPKAVAARERGVGALVEDTVEPTSGAAGVAAVVLRLERAHDPAIWIHRLHVTHGGP
jgi:hypothetical protein